MQRGRFMAFADALRFVLALKAAGLRIAATSSSKNTRPVPRAAPGSPHARRPGRRERPAPA
jgi:hypothetical protein